MQGVVYGHASGSKVTRKKRCIFRVWIAHRESVSSIHRARCTQMDRTWIGFHALFLLRVLQSHDRQIRVHHVDSLVFQLVDAFFFGPPTRETTCLTLFGQTTWMTLFDRYAFARFLRFGHRLPTCRFGACMVYDGETKSLSLFCLVTVYTT